MSKTKNKSKPIVKVGATNCKDCIFGFYVQANFKSITGEKAKCKMCEDRNLDATQLPLRELMNRLSQDYTQLTVKKYYPSINNFCKEHGELYDDGKSYKCPKCNKRTVKKFALKIESAPNYFYKHKLNEFFKEMERVSFSHKDDWLTSGL